MITLNEEDNIGLALDRMARFDEVIIVDSGSTDRTLDIARGYPNVTTHFNAWPGFSAQKAFALSLCRNDWVLNVDADEILSDQYIDEIERLIEADEIDGLESVRILLRWGKRPRCFDNTDRVLRFFRRSNGHYEPRRVHESITVDGCIGYSDAPIYHCENLSFGERVRKANSYSEAKAEDKFEQGKKTNLLTVGLVLPVSFLQLYLFKGHFLDGVGGFMTSMNHAYYCFLKHAKLWEKLHCSRSQARAVQSTVGRGQSLPQTRPPPLKTAAR
jgi:glycosyltransferase involved in cell wall biosynthesis